MSSHPPPDSGPPIVSNNHLVRRALILGFLCLFTSLMLAVAAVMAETPETRLESPPARPGAPLESRPAAPWPLDHQSVDTLTAAPFSDEDVPVAVNSHAPPFMLTTEIVDTTGDVGRYASLAEVANQPMLAYYDATNSVLKTAHYNGTVWQIETVDADGDAGQYASLAVVGGQPSIAYFVADPDYELRYARFDGTAWQIETVDPAPAITGAFASLVDVSGQPAIAYYDATNSDLKYAAYDGAAWQIEVVDSEGDVGRHASLALVAGQPHIGYHDVTNASLKVAAFDGIAWQTETVDATGDAGQYASIVEVDGRPAIAYHDGLNDTLKVARFNGAVWQIQTVDASSHVGHDTSAVVWNGRPLISYYDVTNGNAKAALFDGSDWHIRTVDRAGDVGRFTTLAVVDGLPAMGYYDATQSALKYLAVRPVVHYAVAKNIHQPNLPPGEVATYTITIDNLNDQPYAGVAVSDTLPAGVTFVPDSVTIAPPEAGGVPGAPPLLASGMSLAAGGAITVTYRATVDLGQPAGTVVVNVAEVTSDEAAGPVVVEAGLTVLNAAPVAQSDWITTLQEMPITIDAAELLANDSDANGDPLIFELVTPPIEGSLSLVEIWQNETIDSGATTLNTSLAVVDDQPAISYYDSVDDGYGWYGLKYARFDGLTWQVEEVDNSGVVGRDNTLAIVDGQPAISYYDSSHDDLKYARFDGSTWQIEVVDSYGDVGSFTSLALVDGRPAISYYDRTNGDLKYARFDGLIWQIVTVDSTGDVGWYTSLAVVDDQPAISYHDRTNEDLKYARFDGLSWQIETVDSVDSVGWFASLDVVGDQPAISYFDDTNGDLKLARSDGLSWQIETVDSEGLVGSYTSLAIVDGQPAISYFDITNSDLKYARFDGHTWQIVTVDSAGSVGANASLAVVRGRPAISYIDGDGFIYGSPLKYTELTLQLDYSPAPGSCDSDVFAYRANDGELASAATGVSISVACTPSVALTAMPTLAEPGDLITFTLSISNPHAEQFSEVAVYGTPPEGLAFLAGSPTITPPEAGGATGAPPWLATGITLAPQAEVTVTYQVTVEYGVPHGILLASEIKVSPQQLPISLTASTIITILNVPPVAYADWTTTVQDLSFTFDATELLANDEDANGDQLRFVLQTPPLAGVLSQSTGDWQIGVVDGSLSGGSQTSLQVIDGQPAISYGGAGLKYARLFGQAWQIETVDGDGVSAFYTSLTVVHDQPAISYYDATYDDLKYARFDGLEWQVDTVDSAGNVGAYTSLAVVDGQPAISYLDASHSALKYARFDGQAWQVETVDNDGSVGQHTDLALVDGQPAISYYDYYPNKDLKYARFDGQTWHVETVDSIGDVGQYTSLATVSGYPALSYYNATNRDLKYAYFDGQAWQIETVDSDGWVGRHTSLAIVDGQPAVSYLDDTNHALKYARFNGQAWQIVTVDNDDWLGGHTSLAIVNGQPAISYYDDALDDNRIKYAEAELHLTYTPLPGWCGTDSLTYSANDGEINSNAAEVSVEVVCPPAVSMTAMPPAAEPGDLFTFTVSITNPHTVAFSGVAVTGSPPEGLTFVPGSTAIEPPEAGGAAGEPPWLAVGVDVAPGAAVTVTYRSTLDLGIPRDTAFANAIEVTADQLPLPLSAGTVITVLNAAPVAQADWITTSLNAPVTFDAATLLLNDSDTNNERLHVMLETPPLAGKLYPTIGAWQSEPVDSTGDVGDYTSLVTVDGQPAVSYYDNTNDDLKYARFDGQAWQIETVDSVGDVGKHTSLAIIDGQPAISYFDDTNDDLKYAHYDGRVWQAMTVDNIGDVGRYNSLAVVDGQPAISFFDDTNDDLKYARFDGQAWQVETVDSVSVVGGHTALAVVDGQPAISYASLGVLGRLKYARFDGQSWHIETVDSEISTGLYTSLAVVDTQPAISYYSGGSNRELKYAHFDGQVWQIVTVDSVGDVGWYTSLAVVNGRPAISYYDSNNDDLKYAHFDGQAWLVEAVSTLGNVGEYTSLAIVRGQPAISYRDATNGDLKLAEAVPQLTYAPPLDLCGVDGFTYLAADGQLFSEPTFVWVSVTGCPFAASSRME